MQARFTTEEETAERRYRPETVQKAAALAEKLQQERRETLSATEAEQMAEELGIEPELMRQALATVARSEAAAQQPVQATYPPPAYVAAQGQTTTTQTARRVPPVAFIGLAFPIFFGFMAFFFLIARSEVVQAPMPPAPMVAEMQSMPLPPTPTPARAMTPPAAVLGKGLLHNASFEQANGANTYRAGSTDITGWTVAGGEVSQVAGGVEGNYALRLGKQGVVTQTFRTQPGQKYRVSLRVSGTPGSVARSHEVDLSVQELGTRIVGFTDLAGAPPAEWTRGSLEFTAEQAATQIAISTARSHPDPGSPLIDDVIVTPIP